jgi:hypothetical protein
MSSSTKREVSHDPREIEPKHRRSSRLNKNHLGSHSRKSYTSLSTEKAKLETLYSPNKGSPKVIKSHEDSENSNSNSKSASKMSFWGSPELSPGIQKLLMQ